MGKRAFLALGLSAAVGLAAAPAAASADKARTRSVPYGDLDLSRESGVQAFKRRIDEAVIAVCGAKLAGDGVRNREVSSCRAETRAAMAPRIAQAINVHAPRLTALEVTAATP